MARTKTITVEAEDFPPNPPGNPPTSLRTLTIPDAGPEPVEYDDVTALNNVLSELGASEDGGGFVTVFRECDTPGMKKPDEYLERFAASEFSLDDLKRRWGAGKYKINVYHSGGAGLAARKVITIAKDPNAAPPSNAPQTSAATDLTPILQTMQQGFEKMAGVMLQLSQQNHSQPSRMEMLEELRLMAEMFKQPTPAPQVGILEAMKLGAEMAANGAGGESNNAWVGKIIDQLGPVLMPALGGAIAGAAKRAEPVNAPRPALASPPAVAAPVANPQEEEAPVNIILVNYLKMLQQAAAKSAPVEEYADSVLNAIPASMLPDVEAMLRPDDWQTRLRAHTNAADLYPVWFGQLRDTLIQYIDDDRAAAAGVGAHLTGSGEGDSVLPHENANGEPGSDAGVSGGTA